MGGGHGHALNCLQSSGTKIMMSRTCSPPKYDFGIFLPAVQQQGRTGRSFRCYTLNDFFSLPVYYLSEGFKARLESSWS